MDKKINKVCPKCTLYKSHNVRKDGSPQSYCVECVRAYSREHYRKNRNAHNERRAQNGKVYRNKMRKAVDALKDVPCTDCGQKFPPFVMDFDHLDGYEKTDCIANLVNWSSLEKILAEMAKCEIVCSNCHRIRTWNRAHGV